MNKFLQVVCGIGVWVVSVSLMGLVDYVGDKLEDRKKYGELGKVICIDCEWHKVSTTGDDYCCIKNKYVHPCALRRCKMWSRRTKHEP